MLNDTFENYVPKALYFEDADYVEYVRCDSPVIYRRIDDILTLVLDVESRAPVGFKIKGFKHLYYSAVKPNLTADHPFPPMISILESLMTKVGNEIFKHAGAYRQAAEIAQQDDVILEDLPSAA